MKCTKNIYEIDFNLIVKLDVVLGSAHPSQSQTLQGSKLTKTSTLRGTAQTLKSGSCSLQLEPGFGRASNQCDTEVPHCSTGLLAQGSCLGEVICGSCC